ncbi:5-formyltetrahydrofolate cyclo-ligase [Maritimibacter sp. DP1N21-5]|uniref:5-formyltetrahydrofolate cyclo-ligase n=1 Tax=Maritimibacter sp. DP1N21-5 TaxID=2836867 RepID=UPI001C471345|nr:5-formyltetrahydrofolate cyclo-ligase [Maritimibacter sp. DP1N21-5]
MKDVEKRQVRAAAFIRREQAHNASLDALAQENLALALGPFRGRPIAGYLPIRTEVSPIPVMAKFAAFGPVGVPVVAAKHTPLTFRGWSPDVATAAGAFGADVPIDGEDVVPEVLIVPLVAFDRNGGRLGYGGGFYDRTLEVLRRQRRTIAIGYAYGAQEVASVPLEPTDQPLDMIVTEAGILRF